MQMYQLSDNPLAQFSMLLVLWAVFKLFLPATRLSRLVLNIMLFSGKRQAGAVQAA